MPPLVVMTQYLRDLPLLRMLRENLGALNRMGLDDFVLFGGQLPGLQQDRIGNRDLPEVMENATAPDRVGGLVTHAQQPCHRFATLADTLGVTKRLAIPLVNDATLHDVRVAQPRV